MKTKNLKKVITQPVILRFFPLFLIILSILSYGVLTPFLGFYWDDLTYLYLSHSQGIGGYPSYMSSDRPFSALFFMLEVFLFGNHPLGYHFFALILRWASAYILYLILEKIFPSNQFQNIMAATLFLLFPGFLQQSISLIYSLHFTVLLLFLFSVFFMILSFQDRPHRFQYTFLGLACSLGVFASEYFAFLELIRPVLIYFFFSRQKSHPSTLIKGILQIWLPYFLVFLTFITWRVFIYQFPTYSPDLLYLFQDNFYSGISHLLSRIARDSFTVLIQAWVTIFSIQPINFEHLNRMFLLLFVSMAASLLVWVQSHQIIQKSGTVCASANKAMFIAGVLLILLAGIPIWVTDIPIKLEFAWDRLTLPFSLGVSLVLTSLLSMVIKNHTFLAIIFCLLSGFSSNFHLRNTFQYQDEWVLLQDFFRQFSWRAPGLARGTTLLTDKFPLQYYSDNSLTAPLNWLYDTDNHSLQLNYMFYFLDVRLGRRLPSLEKGLEINQPYRSFIFKGDTDHIILLQYHPPACMHLIDENSRITLRNDSVLLRKAIRLSNMDLIQSQPTYTFPPFFTSEAGKDWCYYYQKADLARQRGKWTEVIQLFNDANEKNLEPFDSSELFPFLEAFGQVADFNSAMRISKQILEGARGMEKSVCATWRQFMAKIPFKDAGESIAQSYYSELKCMH